jgi:hypothetical protein
MGKKRLRRRRDHGEGLESGAALGTRRAFDAQLSREDQPWIGPGTSPRMWRLSAVPLEELPPIVAIVNAGPLGS